MEGLAQSIYDDHDFQFDGSGDVYNEYQLKTEEDHAYWSIVQRTNVTDITQPVITRQ